jgi:hypothetical protein
MEEEDNVGFDCDVFEQPKQNVSREDRVGTQMRLMLGTIQAERPVNKKPSSSGIGNYAFCASEFLHKSTRVAHLRANVAEKWGLDGGLGQGRKADDGEGRDDTLVHAHHKTSKSTDETIATISRNSCSNVFIHHASSW